METNTMTAESFGPGGGSSLEIEAEQSSKQ